MEAIWIASLNPSLCYTTQVHIITTIELQHKNIMYAVYVDNS